MINVIIPQQIALIVSRKYTNLKGDNLEPQAKHIQLQKCAKILQMHYPSMVDMSYQAI